MIRKRLNVTVLVMMLMVPLVNTSCANNPPPNLSPAALTAWNNTRVQGVLDLIRNTVDDGTKTVPPLFSGATDVKVATWHKSALTVIHATGNGWKPVVLTSLDELAKDLPPSEQDRLVPYIRLAKTIISEVKQ